MCKTCILVSKKTRGTHGRFKEYGIQSKRLSGFAFTLAAIAALCLIQPEAFGANCYFGTNNAAGNSYSDTGSYWGTTLPANGGAAFTAADAMIFGVNATDFAAANGFGAGPYAYTISMSDTLTGGTISVGATNVAITLGGSSNGHLNTTTTVVVTNYSTLIWANSRDGGYNFNSKACTFTGPGTNTFTTDIGGNSTATLTQGAQAGGAVNGVTVNLDETTYGSYALAGSYDLYSGTLNFQTTAACNSALNSLVAGSVFLLGWGSPGPNPVLDNTSGSAQTLSLGAGSYQLAGDFTFQGSSSLSFGNYGVSLTGNPRRITVNNNTLIIGGVISNAPATSGDGIVKLGAGNLILMGASTYTGNTTILGGTLALSNSASIATSPTLGVSSAMLDISGLTTPYVLNSTLGLTNATLTLVIPQATTTTNFAPATLSLGGTTNFVNVLSMPVITSYPARFHLVKYTTLSAAGAFNIGLSNLPSASTPYAGYITNVAATGFVDLVLTTGPAPARTLVWSGTDPSNPDNWDVLNSMNWIDTGNGNIAANYNQNDIVRFDDSATGPTSVAVVQGVTPGLLTVSNNVLSYIFNNGGGISGPVALTKQGTGTLLLQETGDTYSGGMNISGGTVIIDSDNSGEPGNVAISSGATLQLGTNDMAGVLPAGTVTVNGTLNFNRSDNPTINNNMNGGGLVEQLNTNTVELNGTSSGNWTTLIENGTLQVGNNAALGSLPGGTVTITNGGTFDLGPDNTANFGTKQFIISGAGVGGNGAIVNSSGNQQLNAFQTIVLSNNAAIGGLSRWDMRNGTPLLNLNGFTLTKTNVNHVAVVSGHVTSGNILIQSGTMSFEVTPVFDAGASTITVGSSGILAQYENTFGSFTRSIVLDGGTNQNLAGAGTITYLDAPILLAANSTLQSGGVEYFDGPISDGGSGYGFEEIGTGTNVLTATNTYSGATIIDKGYLCLTNKGSIANSALIVVTNGGAFDVSGLAGPLSGTSSLVLGDDSNGSGTLNVGTAGVTNFNSLTLSYATLNLAVGNPNVPCAVVTNLNLGDGGSSTINITTLPLVVPTQFPLIKYASATGPFNVGIGSLPSGYTGTLVNNTANNSIDLQITGSPAGIWNGASPTDNNWSDSANWGNEPLTGTDVLIFGGTSRLNNTNDTSSTETASSIAFLPGAGSFTLNGNGVVISSNVVNNSSNPQTVDLGLNFGANGTNYSLNGGTAGLFIGGGLTNTFGSPGYTTLTLAGTGVLTNILNSTTTAPGGTNIVLLSSASANWTLVNNGSSTAMTVPWDFQINNGTFNFGSGSSAPTLNSTSTQGEPQDNQVGNTSGSTATLNMTAGTWTTSARLNTALANSSTGVVNQVGGTLSIGSQFQGANGGTSNAMSIVNVSGGILNIGGGVGQFYVASRDQGILTVSNTAAVNCGTLDVARNANGSTRGAQGVVNLNGGILTVGRVGTATANSQAGPATSGVNPSAAFNFNGGTLQASTNSTTFFQGSTASPAIPITTTVKSGGAIINDGGFAITVLEPFQHDSTLGAAHDGGLLKLGGGTLTIASACTYNGNTVISNGTLLVSNSIASAVRLANGTLTGTGTISLGVTNNGTVTPGSVSAIGTLTCQSDVLNNAGGTNLFKLNASASPSNDVLNVGGNLTCAGTLAVQNLGGTYVAGQTFKLYNVTGSTLGTFAATNLPSIGTGLALSWSTATATLTVVQTVNPNPTNITAVASGGTLTLSWPADHTGWYLQAQTNNLSTGLRGNWVDVAGSSSVNSVIIPINPANGTVFYRLSLNP